MADIGVDTTGVGTDVGIADGAEPMTAEASEAVGTVGRVEEASTGDVATATT